jgi:hypothetical protein
MLVNVILCWFAASVFSAVVGNAVFVMWLRAHDVPMTFMWTGLPWYVDRVYVEWCRSQGRAPGRILRLRRIALVNVIAAALVGVPLIQHLSTR